MSFFYTLFAAGSFATLVSGAPLQSALSARAPISMNLNLLDGRSTSAVYSTYTGDGMPSAGWPTQNKWVSSYDTMFSSNKVIMSASCTQFGVANNSPTELSALYHAIKTVAGETGIDERFILAIVLQESNGCVRAPTTNYGVRNPGLMQDHNGAATCNENGVQNPCPAATITQMIRDGTAGTSSGDGLKQCIAESGATDVSKYYKAARIYNSGSIAAGGDLGAGIATHCYASDIANRLTGWTTGPHDCTVGTTAATTVTTASSSTTSASTSGNSSSSSGSISSTAEKAPGFSASCTSSYVVASGDTCNSVAAAHDISFAQLQSYNTGLDATCSNLWAGYQYCVAA